LAAKTTTFTWTDDEVELLLTVAYEYKVSKKLYHQKEILPAESRIGVLLSFSFGWSVTAEKKSAFGHISACCFDKALGLKKARDLTADKGKEIKAAKVKVSALLRARLTMFTLVFAPASQISRQNTQPFSNRIGFAVYTTSESIFKTTQF